jgi:hypothetical protein
MDRFPKAERVPTRVVCFINQEISYEIQTGSGAHPASCTMGTGGPFPGGKSAAGP